MPKLTCIAHRGGHLDHTHRSHNSHSIHHSNSQSNTTTQTPENSLAAIRHSLSIGADVIEIDVWQIEGELLVTHDRRLGRQLPGQGRLLDQPLQDLLKLKLSNGEAIPKLADILNLCLDHCQINIEIKGQNTVTTLISALKIFSSQHNISLDHVIVSSFDHCQLQLLQKQLPQVKRGVLLANKPLDLCASICTLNPYSIHFHIGIVDRELVEDAHNQQLLVWVYTANHADEWQQLIDLGVDGIFTDTPGNLLKFLGNQ